MKDVYTYVEEFKKKYHMTVAWRLKQNSRIVEKHLNPDEKVTYAFVTQKGSNPLDIFSTCVVALTNKRLLIGRDRVVVGYFLDSITPDLFNDLKVSSGIVWGKIHIDTVKEFIVLSNIDKKALPEIESKISSFMMDEKKLYKNQRGE